MTNYSYKDLTYYSLSFKKYEPSLLYKCYVRKTVKSKVLNGKFDWKNVLDFNHECKNHDTHMTDDLIVNWDVAVWVAPISEHLVHKHSKGPHIRGRGITMLQKALGCFPSHW